MYEQIIPGSLDAFTLFLGRKDGKDVWQLSYKHRNEPGWSVHHVSEATARRFLDMLSGENTEPPEITYLKPQVELMRHMAENAEARQIATRFIERSIDAEPSA